MGRLAEKLIVQNPPPPNDDLLAAEIELDIDTLLARRKGVICRALEGPGYSAIQYSGGKILGPEKIAPALRYVAEHRSFSVRSIAGDLTEREKLVLARRLVRDGLLEVRREQVNSNLVRQIVADGSTLWERLEGSYVPVLDSDSARLAEARFEKWSERAARKDSNLFQQRLSWLDTTPEKVSNILGKVRLRRRASAMGANVHRNDGRRCKIDSRTSRNHPAIRLRQSSFPSQRLASGDSRPLVVRYLSPEILAKLIDDLLRALSYIAAPTLYLEFSVFRSEHGYSKDAARERDERFTKNLRPDCSPGGFGIFFPNTLCSLDFFP